MGTAEKKTNVLLGGLAWKLQVPGSFFFFMDCPVPQLRIWEHRKDSKEFPRLKVIERPAWPRVGPSLGLLPLARPLNAGRASTGVPSLL